MLTDHSRIVVVGTSGAGKTTFARALAGQLGFPHIELDALHWGPKWSPNPDFAERVRAAATAEAWVLDGNYHAVREHVWKRATAVVWLNYSFPVVFGRAVSRTIRRLLTREVIFSGNRESLRTFLSAESIPIWVIRTYHRHRREYPGLFSEPRYRHLEIFEVGSPAEGDALLELDAAGLARPRANA